jgi:hypothetical protein
MTVGLVMLFSRVGGVSRDQFLIHQRSPGFQPLRSYPLPPMPLQLLVGRLWFIRLVPSLVMSPWLRLKVYVLLLLMFKVVVVQEQPGIWSCHCRMESWMLLTETGWRTIALGTTTKQHTSLVIQLAGSGDVKSGWISNPDSSVASSGRFFPLYRSLACSLTHAFENRFALTKSRCVVSCAQFDNPIS